MARASGIEPANKATPAEELLAELDANLMAHGAPPRFVSRLLGKDGPLRPGQLIRDFQEWGRGSGCQSKTE